MVAIFEELDFYDKLSWHVMFCPASSNWSNVSVNVFSNYLKIIVYISYTMKPLHNATVQRYSARVYYALYSHLSAIT